MGQAAFVVGLFGPGLMQPAPVRPLQDGLGRDEDAYDQAVTLPMAKARGFSAERHDAERLAGCPPERAGVRMDGQHTCEWSVPRLFYPLAACPAERPEHATGCAKCTGPKATPHGVIARAHTGSIARVFEQRKRRGPFTPMPEGRGPLAPKW